MNVLKEKLLKTNLVSDNIYLDKYCELIVSNKNRKREKYKCQQHHIIPRCYYKKFDLEVDNTSDNTVILLHKDHVLSHIYLEKCSCVDWFKHYNGTAVRFALNNSTFKNLLTYESERLFIENLDIYQQVIEDCNRLKSQHFKGHIVSEETKQKISNSLKGHKLSIDTRNKLSGFKWYTDGFKNIQIRDVSEIPEGFYAGRTPPSQWLENVTKANQLRNTKPGNTGKVCVNKNNKICYINKNELQEYLLDGYVLGRPPLTDETKDKISLANKGKKHKPLTEECKKKIGDSLKGRHISNEQKLQISTKNRNRKYIYKDGVQKFVTQEQLPLYLEDGWEIGRKSRIGHKVSEDTRNKISNKLKKVE